MPDGGTYSVIKDRRNDYYPNPRSLDNLKANVLPDFDPDLEGFTTRAYDALPDVITHHLFNGAPGLFMNERTISIFDKFNMCNHAVFPGSIIYNRKKISYFWMHIASNLDKYINFKESKFGLGNSFYRYDIFEMLPDGIFNDFDEYFAYFKKDPSYRTPLPVKLKFNHDFDGNLDFMLFWIVAPRLYASERLVKALQEADITGLEYRAVDIFDL